MNSHLSVSSVTDAATSAARPTRRGAAAKLCIAVLLSAATSATAGSITRESLDSSGAQATGYSVGASLSANGRIVAFSSGATDLVAGDTNGEPDIFVRDRKKGTTTRVSVDSSGVQATGGSSAGAAISANGRFVAFYSDATNLVAADANGIRDVFVHDRKKGTTKRVSVDSAGAEADSGSSSSPSISGNGRLVAFNSSATNLVAGDTNGLRDVFVHDVRKGKTVRVSVDSSGAQSIGGDNSSPTISGNGRFVAFASTATNLVPADTNDERDMFVYSLKKGRTERVSLDSAGAQATGGSSCCQSISANGRYVAFQSGATNLVSDDTNEVTDHFLRDVRKKTTIRVSLASNGAQQTVRVFGEAVISPNARCVAFNSEDTGLTPGDTNGLIDVFLWNRKTRATTLLTVDPSGAPAIGTGQGSFAGSMSKSGRLLGLHSSATNLAADDTNAEIDVFLIDTK